MVRWYVTAADTAGRTTRAPLNFIAESNNESEIKKLLPSSHYLNRWWKESAIARDIGPAGACAAVGSV